MKAIVRKTRAVWLFSVVLALTVDASEYVWTGKSGNSWTNAANWTVGGVTAQSLPGAADSALFPEGRDWSVSIPQMPTVTKVTANGNVAFSGARIRTGSVLGSGVITIGDNAGFQAYDYTGATMVIENDICVTASDEAPAGIFGNTDHGGTTTSRLTTSIPGKLTGKGKIQFAATRMYCPITGDLSGFEGTLEIVDTYQTRNNTNFRGDNFGCEKARFIVRNSSAATLIPNASRATFRFGELTGSPSFNNSNSGRIRNVLEIGHLGTDFSLGGIYYSSAYYGLIASRGHTIRKVGKGEMTFTGTGVYAFDLAGGTMSVSSDTAIRTYANGKITTDIASATGSVAARVSFNGGALRFVGDAAISPVIVDSKSDIIIACDTDHVVTNAVDASNLAGFVKRGDGVLTIDADFAVTGEVSVVAGTLVLRAAASDLVLAKNTYVDAARGGRVYLKNVSAKQGGIQPVALNMNADWLFAKAAGYPLQSALAEKDSVSWTEVSLPHSINAHDTFNSKAADAGGAGWRGIAFYKKTFTLDPDEHDLANSKFIVEFETMRQGIYLWVNDTPVGYYEAGIVSTGFDITDCVKAGENVIFVAADSTSSRGLKNYLSETKPGSEWGARDGCGYQWNCNDFNPTEGGLTGSVKLHVKPMAYLTLPLYNNLKTQGTYVTASDFDFESGKAKVRVRSEVRNESGGDIASAVIRVTLRDAFDGSKVSSFVSDATALPVASDAGVNIASAVEGDVYSESPVPTRYNGVDAIVIDASAEVGGLSFWSPDTPHLYDVTVELLVDDEPVDAVNVRTGFREVTYDKDGGLKINGKQFWLTGYAQRSTDEWAAMGIPPQWMQDYDAKLIRDSGANFIRWMHVAPKPAMERAYDKYGIVNICPAGDKEGDQSGRCWAQRTEAMRDTMIYFRNSPSALFWEGGNQVISAAHMAEMTALRKSLDPDGQRRMGCRGIKVAETVAEAEWVGTMLGRHGASAQSAMEATGNFIPVLECEYAREESPRRVWDDFTPPDYDYICKYAGGSEVAGCDTFDLTQEDFIIQNLSSGYSYFYGNRVTGKLDKTYSGCAALCWTDSIQHGRNTGSENARMSGRVDPVRMPKPSFYAYKAAQSLVPAVKIVGHWSYPQLGIDTYITAGGAQRDPTRKTVWVVGSVHCAKVVLKVNQEIVGECAKPENIYLYRFDNVDITQSGQLLAEAYDKRGNLLAIDIENSASTPSALDISVTTGPDGFLADGSDIAMVDVRLVDESGVLIPYGTARLEFAISGVDAVFMGGYNSGTFGETSPIGKDWVNLEAGQNRVFVRAGREAGTVSLAVTCAELGLSASCAIPVRPVESENGFLASAVQTFEANAVEYTPKTIAEHVQDLGQNAIPAQCEVLVNEQPVVFVLPAEVYKPDVLTGVVMPIVPVLAEMSRQGCTNFTYSVTTDDEGLIVVDIASGTNEIRIVEGMTDLLINGDEKLTNYEFMRNGNGEIVCEFDALVPYLEGVESVTGEDGRTYSIIAETPPRVCWWTGATGTNDWSLGENWTLADGSRTMAPRSNDSVVFTNSVEIILTKDISVMCVTNTAALSFVGEGTVTAGCFSNGGNSKGTLTLAGQKFCAVSGSSLVFDEDVHFVDGTSTGFATLSTYTAVEFNGAVTGAGTIVSDQRNSNNRGYCVFRGDCSGFTGAYNEINVSSAVRDGTSFKNGSSASGNAAYQVTGSWKGNTLGTSGQTYRFGAYDGNIIRIGTSIKNVVVEIGARDDVPSRLGGNVADGNFTLEKVGTNVLELAAVGYASVSLKEGNILLCEGGIPDELVFMGGVLTCAEGVDPSSVIVNSTSAIIYDDEGRTAEWASLISASNAGGFVKRGAGMLILDEIPLFDGTITVEEGVLVLPEFAQYDDEVKSRINVARGAVVRYSLPMEVGKIYWDEPATINSDADVVTNGVLHCAYHYNYSASYIGVNGVVFSKMYSTVGNFLLSLTGANRGYSDAYVLGLVGMSGVSPSYRSLLRGHRGGDAGTTNTVTITGLTPNSVYIVQLWFQQSNVSGIGACVSLDGATSALCNTLAPEAGPGQFVTGEFIAASDRQSFVIVGENGMTGTISAIQVREFSEEVEWDASGDGVTWDVSGSNWSGLDENLEYWLAPDAYRYDAKITRDAAIVTPSESDIVAQRVNIENANVSITPGKNATLEISGALDIRATGGGTNTFGFGDGVCAAQHTLFVSNGTHVVAKTDLDLDSFTGEGSFESSKTQTFNVEGGEQVFVGPVTGSMGVVKEGAGRLVLSNELEYTGNTTVKAGTLAAVSFPYKSKLHVEKGAVLDLMGKTPEYDENRKRFHIVNAAYISGTVSNGLFRVQSYVTFYEGAVMYIDPSRVKLGASLMQVGKSANGIENLELRMSDGSRMDPSLMLAGVKDSSGYIKPVFAAKPVYALVAAEGTEYLWSDYAAAIQSANPAYYCIVTNSAFEAAASDVVFDASLLSTEAMVNGYLAKVATVLEANWEGRYRRGLLNYGLGGFAREFADGFFAGAPVGRVNTSESRLRSGDYIAICDRKGAIRNYSGLIGELFTSTPYTNKMESLFKATNYGAVRIANLSGAIMFGDPLLRIPSWTEEEMMIELDGESKVRGEFASVYAISEGDAQIEGECSAYFKLRDGLDVSGTNVTIGAGVAGGIGGDGITFAKEGGAVVFRNTLPFWVSALNNVSSVSLLGTEAKLDWSGVDPFSIECIVLGGFNTLYYDSSEWSLVDLWARLSAICEFASDAACLELVDSSGTNPAAYFTKPGADYPTGSFTISNLDVEGALAFYGVSLTAASAVLRRGGTLTLASDMGLSTNMTVSATDVTIDFAGHSITNAGARWMIDVGTNEVTIANGCIEAGNGYGLFVTDGGVSLTNVQVVSRGRALQIAGSGYVLESEDSALVNTGNDPAMMIVGGYDGRAEAHLRGVVSNVCGIVEAGRRDYRYAVSGRDDDLAGAEIYIYDTASVGTLKDGGAEDEDAVYFPEEGGDTYARVEHPDTKNFLDVPKDWLGSRGYRVNEHAHKGANGIAAWESYALGLDPLDETSLPRLRVSISEDNKFVVEMDDLDPAEGVTPVCSLIELGEDLKSEAAERDFDGKAEIEMDNADDRAHCFRVRVKIRF